MKGTIKIFCWGMVLFGFYEGFLLGQTAEKEPQERLRLVSADSLLSVSENDKVVWQLLGNVQMVQGEAFISCDEARWWEKNDKIFLSGEVTIYDGKHTLRSDRVHYDGNTRMETASGRVTLETGQRKLTSHRLDYYQEKELASAYGNVVITDFIERATLTGERANYDRGLDYGVVEGRSRLVKVDSTFGERMIVRGLKMEVWGEEQRVLVTDSVKIEKDHLKALCQKAEYRSREDLLILEEAPVVWHWDEEAVSADSTFMNVLKGRRIVVEARKDTIREVVVEGQASSLYHIFDEDEKLQGVNSITGDRIVLTFGKDRLERVEVESEPSQCMGVYTPGNKRMK